MDFNEYQLKAEAFAIYEERLYPVVSLMIESAELADLYVKPLLRGDAVDIERKQVISEAGDVLWNLAVFLKREGIRLEDVAKENIKKLTKRVQDGTIQGSGNER